VLAVRPPDVEVLDAMKSGAIRHTPLMSGSNFVQGIVAIGA
jgi:hypothetical protein